MSLPLALVVRVSHMGGRVAGADNVHTDRDQIATAETYARTHGETLHILPSELDVSGGGKLEDRPSLLAAVEGVERGEYSGIIVAYLSRLGRSVREQLRAWDRVEAAGGRIIVVQEGIDTSTPTGRLQRTIMLGIAEHELELHADRFENLKASATERGIWQQKQTPRGYARDDATRRLVPDSSADDVRAAFRARIAGATIANVATDLGMTPAGARALLRNRTYLGELRVGPHFNPAAHEPLVDAETFDNAQQWSPRPARRVGGPATLAGLVRCSACGHVMTRSTRAYECRAHYGTEKCPAPAAMTVALLDAHVEALALPELARLRATGDEGDTIGPARATQAAAERELSAYLAAVSAADIGAEAFGVGARERAANVEAAKAAVRAETSQRPARVGGTLGAREYAELDGSERNALLRALLAGVIVKRAGGRGRRLPVGERVRVVAHGAPVDLLVNRGPVALGIVPVWPDADTPGVLGVAAGEDERPRTTRRG